MSTPKTIADQTVEPSNSGRGQSSSKSQRNSRSQTAAEIRFEAMRMAENAVADAVQNMAAQLRAEQKTP